MINAKTASKLADICNKEINEGMFKNTIESIEFYIHESAQKGHHSISYYIPLRVREEVVKYLEELGYAIYAPTDCISDHGLCWINW